MSVLRWLSAAAAFAQAHPAAAAVAVAAAAVAVFAGWQAGRWLSASARATLRGHRAGDVLTLVAAAVATTVAMTGMWRFFGVVLGFSGLLRALLFAFIELAVVTSAFRARRTMRQFGGAGIDGAAVWALTSLSAVLSSLDARSAAEAVFRLCAPLVAAWLWERGLSLERQRVTGQKRIHWRLTAERVLVWLRLADPAERTAGDVDAYRRIARLARAAKRLGDRRTAGAAAWRQQRAKRQLDAAMGAAVEHAGLASDPARQDDLRDQLGALAGAEALASLNPAAPWERRMREEQAAAAAEALRERAERAERELADSRMRVSELEQALTFARAERRPQARTRTRSTTRSGRGDDAGGIDRDALVAELAAEILAAAGAGAQWHPDYGALAERTGRKLRWCEYVVEDARKAVARTQRQARNDPAAAAACADNPAGSDGLDGHDTDAPSRIQPLALTATPASPLDGTGLSATADLARKLAR